MLSHDGSGGAGSDQSMLDPLLLGERCGQRTAEGIAGTCSVHRIDPERIDVQGLFARAMQGHSPGTLREHDDPRSGCMQPVDAAELGALRLVHDQHIDVAEHLDRRDVCGSRVEDRQRARRSPRAQCGGYCVVLIFHSTSKVWRAAPAIYLHENREGASWDLRGLPTYPSARIAMRDLYPHVFTFGDHE